MHGAGLKCGQELERDIRCVVCFAGFLHVVLRVDDDTKPVALVWWLASVVGAVCRRVRAVVECGIWYI